jgi:hypothetical protein
VRLVADVNLKGQLGVAAQPEGQLGAAAQPEGLLGVAAQPEGLLGVAAQPEGLLGVAAQFGDVEDPNLTVAFLELEVVVALFPGLLGLQHLLVPLVCK